MNVSVIGGGAAGLMAALTAARDGHCVTLIERQGRVGRKLSATGNGRCNLTNADWALSRYHGASEDWLAAAFSALDTQGTLRLFHELGLLTVTEPTGRVYPLTDQAGSVVDVLRFAAGAAGVQIKTGLEVTALRREGADFSLVCGEGEVLPAQRVIVCVGGAAGAHLGGSRQGYGLLTALGHSLTALLPALCPIRTESAFVRALKGVRAQAAAALEREGTVLLRDAGEVQFTETGVSGPVAFALSRTAAAGMTLHLDLLPGFSPEAVRGLLRRRREALPGLTLENLLTGSLHNRLGRTLLRYGGLPLGQEISRLTDAQIRRAVSAIKDFALPVLGTADFAAAQVTAGGVPCREFDPRTLESRLTPGLYAAGEVLDVDGDCGGYNLQWAWSSGYMAGRLGNLSDKERKA